MEDTSAIVGSYLFMPFVAVNVIMCVVGYFIVCRCARDASIQSKHNLHHIISESYSIVHLSILSDITSAQGLVKGACVFPQACDLMLCSNPLVDVGIRMYGQPQCHTAARLAEKLLPVRTAWQQ